jgi:hypothetical protein
MLFGLAIILLDSPNSVHAPPRRRWIDNAGGRVAKTETSAEWPTRSPGGLVMSIVLGAGPTAIAKTTLSDAPNDPFEVHDLACAVSSGRRSPRGCMHEVRMAS